MDNLFESIFSESRGIVNVIIMVAVAIVVGFAFAWMSFYKTKSSKSFFITAAVLPLIVAIVIMLVNGNLGIGVAVAGAFSLVRFRSATGTAKEICIIFVAMALGLALGMGYIAYAVIFCIISGGILMLFGRFNFWEHKVNVCDKVVKITIPEDLDYTNAFDDVFSNYLNKYELIRVKSTNMGSMFKLTYKVELKDAKNEKKFIDTLRCRNGNLEIVVDREDMAIQEL